MSLEIHDHEHTPHFHFSRRTALGLTALVVCGVLIGCTASHSPKAAPEIEHSLSTYLPTWLSDQEYGAIQQTLGDTSQDITQINLAFAAFEPDTATISSPPLPTGLKKIINTMPHTGLSLAIGGANTSLTSWQSAWTHKQHFADSINQTRQTLEATFHRPVDIDIDCETPGINAQEVTDITQAVHDTLPANRSISMAVPADHMLDAFSTQNGQLGDIVKTFRVMTYDENGPWSKQAGPIANGLWVVSSINNWIKKIGSAKRIEVGYPTYGYKYQGAQNSGDAFTKGTSVLYTDIPSGSIHDNVDSLTSEAAIDKAWVSALSPRVIGKIATQLAAQHPDLGGSFFWAMNGLTPDHIKAVNIHK